MIAQEKTRNIRSPTRSPRTLTQGGLGPSRTRPGALRQVAQDTRHTHRAQAHQQAGWEGRGGRNCAQLPTSTPLPTPKRKWGGGAKMTICTMRHSFRYDYHVTTYDLHF